MSNSLKINFISGSDIGSIHTIFHKKSTKRIYKLYILKYCIILIVHIKLQGGDYNTSKVEACNTSKVGVYNTHHSFIWARHRPLYHPSLENFEKYRNSHENFEKIAKKSRKFLKIEQNVAKKTEKSILTRGKGAPFTAYSTHHPKSCWVL